MGVGEKLNYGSFAVNKNILLFVLSWQDKTIVKLWYRNQHNFGAKEAK